MSMISHTVYYYLVSSYNNPPALGGLVWSLLLQVIPTAMTGFMVQCFFTARVWYLSKNYHITGFILLLVLANAGCGVAWVISAMQTQTFVEGLHLTPLTIAINALSAVSDVSITGSLVVLLHWSRTGFKRTDTIINQLIMFVVNTGC